MKKTISVISLILSGMMLLGSCSEQGDAKTDAVISAIAAEAASTVASAELLETDEAQSGTSAVDIDLTAMNSTMVYSVVYDIMSDPEKYYQKTLLVDGYFDTSYDERLDTRYYFVVIPDATACCSQGLEIMLDESKVYPNDYPDVSSDIRVRGTLDRYDEEGRTYYYINGTLV